MAEGLRQSQAVRVKNRRKRYLDLHPEYFRSPELELAEPLLYDRLLRCFLSAEERQNDGKQRGYAASLEADLVRSEAKLEALRHPDPNSPLVYSQTPDGSVTAVERDASDRARNREDGWAKWKDFHRQRFLRGEDSDFDYPTVDANDEYDDRSEEDQTKLEKYLEGEEEQFLGAGTPLGQTGIQDF